MGIFRPKLIQAHVWETILPGYNVAFVAGNRSGKTLGLFSLVLIYEVDTFSKFCAFLCVESWVSGTCRILWKWFRKKQQDFVFSKQNEKPEEYWIIQIYDVKSRKCFRELRITAKCGFQKFYHTVGFNSKFMVVAQSNEYEQTCKMNIDHLEAIKNPSQEAIRNRWNPFVTWNFTRKFSSIFMDAWIVKWWQSVTQLLIRKWNLLIWATISLVAGNVIREWTKYQR